MNIRFPCRLQPSAPLWTQQRRVAVAKALPHNDSNNQSSEHEWPGASSGGGSSYVGEQRQQHQQQQQQMGSWGSSWTGRTKSSSPKKPASFFNKSSADQSKRSSGGNKTAPEEAAPLDPKLEASIRQSVDRAAEALQEIVNEVLNEMLIEEASAYVLDEEGPSLQLNQAVRNAVVKRLEWLDANFLAALNAYLSAPSVAANSELRTLLTAVRDEVLAMVSARLPPSVQVLDAALSRISRSGRSEVVASAVAGGGGSLPGASLESLGAAAAQLVEDMEDQQVIADRVLLARLVLLREELRLLAQQHEAQTQFFSSSIELAADGEQPESSSSGAGDNTPNKFFAFHRSNLPARCAAFVKELLAVPERDRRLGLITKAFQEDWVGESPPTVQQPQAPSRPVRDNNFSQQHKPESLDIVRPGRFFSTLLAMQAELEQQVVGSGLAAGNTEQTLVVLRQLEAIRLEALVALDRIQRSRPVTAAGSTVSGSNEALDYELDLA